MARELPPSKFGAGTTYGEAGQPHALRQTPPPPPPPPVPTPYTPDADPYGQGSGAYTAAPGQPATGYQAQPTPDPYAGQQFQPAASPPHTPGASSYAPGVPAGGSSGAAIAAAILSLIGAVWYGFIVVRDWEAMTSLFESLGQVSAIAGDSSVAAWYYGAVAAMVAQCVSVPMLFLGGILLLTRSSAGRVMVVLGSLLVILLNVYGAFAAFQAMGWARQFLDELGTDGQFGDQYVVSLLLNIGLPALLAVVAMASAMSSSAKRWCQPPSAQITTAPY